VARVPDLGFKFECSVTAPRQTSESRCRARMSTPACLTPPNAGTGAQPELVRINLARVRGPRQGPVYSRRGLAKPLIMEGLGSFCEMQPKRRRWLATPSNQPSLAAPRARLPSPRPRRADPLGAGDSGHSTMATTNLYLHARPGDSSAFPTSPLVPFHVTARPSECPSTRSCPHARCTRKCANRWPAKLSRPSTEGPQVFGSSTLNR
jgi:hypothetical protein